MEYLKKILLFTIVVFASSRCFSQVVDENGYNKFDKSFRLSIFIPPTMIRNCTPVNCLLKIEVDKEKNITNLLLSDSADSLFVAEFNKNKNHLDVEALEGYMKANFRTNEINTYVIPLSIGFYDNPCAPGNIKIDSMFKYFQFDKKEISNVTFLKGIHTITAVRR